MMDWLVRVPGLRKLSSFRTILAAQWFDWRRNPVVSDVVDAASKLRLYAKRSDFGSLYVIYRSGL
jgi:hypothetical protein